jgi:hypothetical protein
MLGQGSASAQVRHQDHEKGRYYQEQACGSYRKREEDPGTHRASFHRKLVSYTFKSISNQEEITFYISRATLEFCYTIIKANDALNFVKSMNLCALKF